MPIEKEVGKVIKFLDTVGFHLHFFFVSVRYILRFYVKYNRVTNTFKCVFTAKQLYLNLLVKN